MRSTSIILAAIITALVVGFATYNVTKNKDKNEIQTLRNQTTNLQNQLDYQSETDAPAQRPAAVTLEWQTFSDTENGFNIKFPNNWNTTTGTTEGAVVLTNFPYASNTSSNLAANQTKRVIAVINNVDTMNPQAVYNAVASPGDQVSEVTTLSTINASAFKFKISRGNTLFYRVLVPGNNKIFVITNFGNTDNFNEMIQTFSLFKG